jgi:tetratricopeptide (TPR) repeat protein
MDKIEEFFKANKLDEALSLCEDKLIVSSDDVNALLYCGRIYQKKGDTRNAMNYFLKVLENEPENSVAKTSLEILKGIMDYFCKDMINP